METQVLTPELMTGLLLGYGLFLALRGPRQEGFAPVWAVAMCAMGLCCYALLNIINELI